MTATDGVEEPKLAEPVSALRELGARTELLSLKPGQIKAVQHDLQPTQTFAVDKTLDHADPEDYQAVLLPGGAVNAGRLRTEPAVQSFLKQIKDAGKPLAVICHAPRGPVPSGLPRGRTVTSHHTLPDDLRNTGATGGRSGGGGARQPGDQAAAGRRPGLHREMLNLFAAARGA